MAKCQMCGAEVKIGQHCEYCGSMAEPYYYPIPVRLKVLQRTYHRKQIADIRLSRFILSKEEIVSGILQRDFTEAGANTKE